MDPNAVYLAMNEAMERRNLSEARYLALSLHRWLEHGGFYPSWHDTQDVDSRIADVLLRTRTTLKARTL